MFKFNQSLTEESLDQKRGQVKKKSKYLEIHVVIHLDEKTFQFNYCDKRFGTKTVLRTHIRTHTSEKPYECEHCDKKISASSNLRGGSHLEL